MRTTVVLILLTILANGGLPEDTLVAEVMSFDRLRKSEDMEEVWTRRRVKGRLGEMLGEPNPIIIIDAETGNLCTTVGPRTPESGALGVGVVEDAAAAVCALSTPTLVSSVQKAIRRESEHAAYRGQVRNYEIFLQVA